MHYAQAAVCAPHQYQYSGHDPHLWQGSKCHQKGTLGACRGVPRSWEVPPGSGGGPEEEYSPIGEDWGRNRVEMGLGRREQERKQR